MGPRLVGRGKKDNRPSNTRGSIASMGPRLVGRGKLWRIARQPNRYRASMGPRLVGRGKSLPKNVLQSVLCSFNGAASCGTRKAFYRRVLPDAVPSASMGPRLVGRGKCVSNECNNRPTSKLQWGRVLWDAESLAQGRVGTDLIQASMGPRLVGRGKKLGPWCSASLGGASAESPPRSPLPLHRRLLQWGRVLWDAESWGGFDGLARDHSFNGAASCGTRKDRSYGHRHDHFAASMGPRLVGRGKAPAVCVPMADSTLQWGRVLWDAERRRRPHQLVDLALLQWGRVLWDAERSQRHITDRHQRASMGPRLVGRGKDPSKLYRFTVRWLQWGRVLWDAESDPAAGGPRPPNRASMGPRLVGRGKVGLGGPRLAERSFNGAASCGTRKGETGTSFKQALYLLQWGRVLWDAERTPGFAEEPRNCPASMGPRLVGRGKRHSPVCHYLPLMRFNGAASCGTRKAAATSASMRSSAALQWGRVLWDAESCTARTSWRNRQSFNGAASCGTRKVQGQVRGRAGLLQLQWGRVLWDAESRRQSRSASVRVLASMGPRLVGRGKVGGVRGPGGPKGFNGAASCGTRKDRSCQVPILSAVMMPKSSGCLDGRLHKG